MYNSETWSRVNKSATATNLKKALEKDDYH
jgi:hypothetical protein